MSDRLKQLGIHNLSAEQQVPLLLIQIEHLERVIESYWLLQIIHGQPVLWGPFDDDATRLGEYDMCLIDPGTEYLIFIDPNNVAEPGRPWAWKPSQEFRQERLDYINNIVD